MGRLCSRGGDELRLRRRSRTLCAGSSLASNCTICRPHRLPPFIDSQQLTCRPVCEDRASAIKCPLSKMLRVPAGIVIRRSKSGVTSITTPSALRVVVGTKLKGLPSTSKRYPNGSCLLTFSKIRRSKSPTSRGRTVRKNRKTNFHTSAFADWIMCLRVLGALVGIGLPHVLPVPSELILRLFRTDQDAEPLRQSIRDGVYQPDAVADPRTLVAVLRCFSTFCGLPECPRSHRCRQNRSEDRVFHRCALL